MAVKLKIGGTPNGAQQPFTSRLVRAVLVCALAGLLLFAAVFGFYYHKYQHIVDQRVNAGPLFASVAQIYAAPHEIRLGQTLGVNYIARNLRQAGYNSNPQLGTFDLRGDRILIHPGPQSYYSSHSATIDTAGGVVQSITADNGAPLRAYKLEPLLITGLSEDKNRTKRRLITYNEIPKNLVNAVTSIEDRHFFEHGGIDYVRIAKCAVQDLASHRMSCGGSTLTQQLARGFFLSPEKKLTRKFKEALITFQLEARFSKQQIFEMYANEINLGQRGSYSINGFGEAAQSFFGKPVGQLDVAECATLAGMIQSPNRYNPYRHPERVTERRNVVLDSMVETGALTKSEAERAKAESLHLAPPNVDASEAPYFIDLVHEQIVQRLGERDLSHESLRIYTSLDPELQVAASNAVEAGMKNVDDLVRKLHRHKTGPITYPQVALIALDPHTGQILALVGGRNYGVSQLDHAVSERPTGSTFKPFVYAAAYSTSINGQSLGEGGVFTALTRINDDPQDFGTASKSYIPGNFVKGEYPGMVTADDALAHSLNIATIALAQQVGYENVAALARSAGILNARGTPSVAIGTYDATPIEMAGAYTVFANSGVHLNPWMLDSVRNASGDILADFAPEARQVLDPRAAFLTQSLLEDVINHGTAEPAVRGHGFTAPAAGKTGTENDSWFAGYTSNLLCIVWIGNDDYTPLHIQGADAAAPIWTEFMKRAVQLPQYTDTKPFLPPPDGVSIYPIDRVTGLLADSSCPDARSLAFLNGTQPANTCSHMSETPQAFGQQVFGSQPAPPAAVPGTPNPAAPAANNPAQSPAEPQPAEPKKPNFFRRLFGGGGNKDDQQQQPPPPPAQ